MSQYLDVFTCPYCGYRGAMMRLSSSIGNRVKTYCTGCNREPIVLAGPDKSGR